MPHQEDAPIGSEARQRGLEIGVFEVPFRSHPSLAYHARIPELGETHVHALHNAGLLFNSKGGSHRLGFTPREASRFVGPLRKGLLELPQTKVPADRSPWQIRRL
jgi:hypothetical protein